MLLAEHVQVGSALTVFMCAYAKGGAGPVACSDLRKLRRNRRVASIVGAVAHLLCETHGVLLSLLKH